MPGGVDSHDPKRIGGALVFQQAGQRARHVAEAEQGDLQNSIFSIRELSSDSSAAFFFRSSARRSRSRGELSLLRRQLPGVLLHLLLLPGDAVQAVDVLPQPALVAT